MTSQPCARGMGISGIRLPRTMTRSGSSPTRAVISWALSRSERRAKYAYWWTRTDVGYGRPKCCREVECQARPDDRGHRTTVGAGAIAAAPLRGLPPGIVVKAHGELATRQAAPSPKGRGR